jgi:hypothetical protein
LCNNSYANTQQINETEVSELTIIFDTGSYFIWQNTEYQNLSLTNKLELLSGLEINDDEDDADEQLNVDLFNENDKEENEYFINYFDNIFSIQNSKPYIIRLYKNVVVERLFDIFWLGKNKYI